MKFEKLGNIVTISKGKKHAPAPKRLHQNFRYIQIEDLRNNDNLKYTDEKGVEVHENDLIIAWDGANAGTIGFGLRGMIGSTLARLRIKEDKEYNTDFIGFFLKGKFDYLRANATGATIPHIDRSSLESLKIPSIDFPEQYEIAKVLSKSEDLIKQRKESIELLDIFLQSTFFKMFGDPVSNEKGWEKVPLSKLGSLDRGVSKNRPRNSPELLGGKYPLIQTGEVSNSGLYITSYTQTYSELGLKQSKLWKKGTMLITIAANIAQTSILTFDACFPDSIVGFITDEKEANTIYVHYLFSFFQEILEKNAPQAAQKNINLALLRSLPVPKPPLPLQNEFALIVDKVEALKKDYNESLNELENLFGSLNQRAFKGELEFKSISQKEMGDPLEGMDLPKDKLHGLDDILKQAGDKAEVVTEEKKKDKTKDKSTTGSPFENISTVTGSILNYKPVLEDVQPFIQKTFRDNYFSFESLKQATVKAGWQYDFETLKNFVFALLRQGKLKQVFADAAFKSSFKESDADFKKIKELNEQMYLQQATTL